MMHLTKYVPISIVLLLPFVVGASALIPEIRHYWVEEVRLPQEFAETWSTRHSQRKELLEELSDVRIGVLGEVLGAESVRSASLLARGTLKIGHYTPISVQLPFSKADLLKGEPSLQLRVGSLAIADILLEAYIHSGDPSYLERATRVAEEFVEFEEGRWLPYGFLWNDHAVAARALFLTRLIDQIVKTERSESAQLNKFFESLDRSVRILANPSHYTFRTNHGIMQSLAVLHIALFASELPAVSDVLEDVVARLVQQMEFFISRDGIVLEHSVGYQEFGIGLLDDAIRYMYLLDRDVPKEWLSKQKRAKEFFGHLIRSDGTVPRHGDTFGLDSGEIERTAGSKDRDWISQGVGYWSSWDSTESHLFVSWANFIGRAHKHADELSLVYWAAGEEWWTSAGYWPFGHPWRDWGTGWDSGNAPHEVGEASDSVRSSRVVRLLFNEHVRLLHLRRERRDGYQVDRIIVVPDGGPWFVIDSPTENNHAPTVSSWSTMTGVSVASTAAADSHTLSSPRSSDELIVNVAGGPGTTFRWTNGSTQPLAGWISLPGSVQPVDTLLINTPAGSWSLVAWNRVSNGISEVFVDEVKWTGPDFWSIAYEVNEQAVIIKCRDNSLSIAGLGVSDFMLELQAGAVDTEIIGVAEQAYRQMATTFQSYRDLLPWRVMVLEVLVTVGVLQLLLFTAFWLVRRRLPPIQALSVIALSWLGVGVWLHAVYFVV